MFGLIAVAITVAQKPAKQAKEVQETVQCFKGLFKAIRKEEVAARQ